MDDIATGIGRQRPQDQVDEWIAQRVRGLSFVDIGGIGVKGTNERASWAQRQGASAVAMADFEPFSHREWQHWHGEIKRIGVTGIKEYEETNIDDPALLDLLGQWDMVHSTGILYHVPNPIHTLLNLRRLVRRYLIVNTVIVPEIIENTAGRLCFPASSVALFAALRGSERAVLAQHYADQFGLPLDELAPERNEGASMPYLVGDRPSYYPYWWVFTKPSFEVTLEMLRMRVLDRFTWKNHAHFVLLEVD